MITVLIVDDHPMVRAGLTAILEDTPDMAVAGEARNAAEALQIAEAQPPDVALVDLMLPGMNGIELIGRLRACCPGVRSIAVTSTQSPDLVNQALAQGASGYVLKGIEAQALCEAIREVAAGDLYLDAHAARALAQSVRQPTGGDYGLTRREYEVLVLLARGADNREISEELVISYYTVKTHVSNIMAKLNVSNRTEATRKALEEQLVRLD